MTYTRGVKKIVTARRLKFFRKDVTNKKKLHLIFPCLMLWSVHAQLFSDKFQEHSQSLKAQFHFARKLRIYKHETSNFRADRFPSPPV